MRQWLRAFVTMVVVTGVALSPAAARPRDVSNPPQNLFPAHTRPVHPIAPVDLAPTFYVEGMPDVIQMNSYTCGCGSFQAVAMYFGYWGYQSEYVKALGTSAKEGTNPHRIVNGFDKLGYQAGIAENMTLDQLKQYLRDGYQIIIDYQAWNDKPEGKDYTNEWEDGHYSVLVGFNDKVVFIEDPCLLGTVGYLTNDEFLSRWHDYEVEDGKRREYVHMAILIKGKHVPQPRFTHID